MKIEPLYTTRRDFLTGTFSFLSAAATLPIFLGATARVLGAPAGPSQLTRAKAHDK